MRLLTWLLVGVAMASAAVAAQERKPPADSEELSLPGCSKGRTFIVSEGPEHEPRQVAVAPGRRFRLEGPKDVLDDIKRREGRLLWLERGRIDGGSRLLESPAGLAGMPVFGTLFAAALNLNQDLLNRIRNAEPETGRSAVTLLPGILLARYLGGSSEAARRYFIALWRILRPAVLGREATEPRIWQT